jgi:hypothetical protein
MGFYLVSDRKGFEKLRLGARVFGFSLRVVTAALHGPVGVIWGNDPPPAAMIAELAVALQRLV